MKKSFILVIAIIIIFSIQMGFSQVPVKVYNESGVISSSNPLNTEPAETITSVQQDKVSVNPYTEVEKDYTSVMAIEIYNSGKNIRIGFDDTTTADTDNYWVIPSSAVGFERDNLNVDSLKVRLKGDTATDTAVVRINIYK